METHNLTFKLLPTNLPLEKIVLASVHALHVAPGPIVNINDLLKIDDHNERLFIPRMKQLMAFLKPFGCDLIYSRGDWWFVVGPLPKPDLNSDLRSFFETLFKAWLKNDCHAMKIDELRNDRTLSTCHEDAIRFQDDYRSAFQKIRDEIGTHFFHESFKNHSIYIHEGNYSKSKGDEEIHCFNTLIDYVKGRHSHITTYLRIGNLTIDVPVLREILSHLPDCAYTAFIRPASNLLIITNRKIVALIAMPFQRADSKPDSIEMEIRGLKLGLNVGPFDGYIKQLDTKGLLTINNETLEPSGKACRCFKESNGNLFYFREIDYCSRAFALEAIRRFTRCEIELSPELIPGE